MATLTKLSTFNARVDSILQGITDGDLPTADRDLAIREAVRLYQLDLPRTQAVEFPGDASGFYLMYGKTVDVDEDDRDAGIDLKSTGADSKLAVKFTLDRRMEVRDFAMFLRRVGTTVAGTVTGEIFTDSGAGDLPVSLVATATAVDIDDTWGAPLGRDAKVRFALANPVSLPAGDYHAVLGSSGYTYASGTNEVNLGVKQTGSPTNDVSTWDGSAWTAFGTASQGILEVTASTPGWEEELGAPLSVEYPAADPLSDETPQVLQQDEWEIFQSADGTWLRFPAHRPATTENVRMTIDRPFVWTEASDPYIDTPPEHFEALCYLAASDGCTRLAVRYGQKQASTITADVADRRTQADIYRSLAKDLKAKYEQLLGIGKDRPLPPSAFGLDLDLEPPHGQGFLFHTRRSR
jgi:hypothetical protein